MSGDLRVKEKPEKQKIQQNGSEFRLKDANM